MGKPDKEEASSKKRHPEARGLFYICVSVLISLSLISFESGFPSENWLGYVGYWSAFGLLFSLGLMSYTLSFFLAFFGILLLKYKEIEDHNFKLLYLFLFFVSGSVLLNVAGETGMSAVTSLRTKTYVQSLKVEGSYPYEYERANYGGVPTYFLYKDAVPANLQSLFSNTGLVVTSSMILLVTTLLLFDLRLSSLFKSIYYSFTWVIGRVRLMKKRREEQKPILENAPASMTASETYYPAGKELVLKRVHEVPFEEGLSSETKITFAKAREIRTADKKAAEKEHSALSKHTNYVMPPLSLVSDAKKVDQSKLKSDLTHKSRILEETLASFGIEAKVGDIQCGPTITSFEVHPAIGVKVQKIKALENDIALNMQAKSIRIIAPIPGKAAVGVEIPSVLSEEVGFKEMLIRYHNGQHKFHIPLLLGKTVSGDEVFSDLTKMPHCLIAGATGSGKSVCINTMIMSILMNCPPEEVKLLLVDPKKVELTPFSGLPHLIAPVITESRGAYAALQWMVKEMTFRYEILKQLGLRNINAFNKRTVNREVEESLDITIPEKMYYLVGIIDEFADLMMTSSSDLETPIARIAQMARAVGIHLILATQRPSREVITGLIKANFPTRIAFKVSSRVNSQIILDENGAETLLGNGDMLFLPPASSQLIRAQGVFIRDEDIQKITQFIKERVPTNYLMPSFDETTEEEIAGDTVPKDELYAQAYELVTQYRVASTTFLQRKLKIGYARAASLMDELEEKGIISAPDGSKPRRVIKDL